MNLFGTTNIIKRKVYALNFAVLMFSLVKMYIFTHKEITGVGFEKPIYLKITFFYIPFSSVYVLIPMANYFSPLVQLFLGHNNMAKHIPNLLNLHIIILMLEVFSVYYLEYMRLWLFLCFLQQLNYSCLDLITDQINTEKLNDQGDSDQAYRSVGAFLGLLLPTFALIFNSYYLMFILMALVFPSIIFRETNKMLIGRSSYHNRVITNKGKIGLPNFILTMILIFTMSIPDTVGDAISHTYAYNHKTSNLVIIKYLVMAIGYGLTHPQVNKTVSQKIGINGRMLPLLLLTARISILYFFPEIKLFNLTESFYFIQCLLDTTSGTLVKNDIEHDNRKIFWSSESNSKWAIPAVVANFIQEQMPPTIKKFTSVWVEHQGSSLNHKTFIFYSGIAIGISIIATFVIQGILKMLVKKDF